MNKLEWCKRKKKGIKIIDPNPNLADKYVEKAENSLETMEATPTEDWKISAAYYTCYYSLCSLLQRTGMQSKIHDCTIKLMNFYDFTEKEHRYIEKLKDKRIDAQYHVTKETRLENTGKVKEFLLKCKKLLEETDFKEKREELLRKL